MNLGNSKPFIRKFSSAVIIQAVLSATNFVVGLLLIRHTSDLQYGYYVLITNFTLLLTNLQDAFISPPLIMRLVRADAEQRADLIGGVLRIQRRALTLLASLSLAIIGIIILSGAVTADLGWLMIAAVATTSTALYREFFRMLLMAYRRSEDVLKADVCYVTVVILGISLAVSSSVSAITAFIVLSVASVVGGILVSRALWRHEAWNPAGSIDIMRQIISVGGWSAAGSGTHWAFSQGYNYMVAGAVDVTAVAALAATRLLMMPVNLLSSGVRSLMMPTATSWLHEHGAAVTFKRLVYIASALATLALVYFGFVWLCRDWIFANLMRRDFQQRDLLLGLWCAIFFVTVLRDQLCYMAGASGLYRELMFITAASAVISLAIVFVAIQMIGIPGAPLGVLIGEICNVIGVILLSLRHIRRSRVALAS